jgi:hypothetical protein
MKRVILSTAIPVLAVCFVLCALNSANALSPTSPVTANASPSPSVTYTLTATLLGHVEIEPGGFYAVAGKKVLLGGLPYIAIVSNCNNPWQCQITTTAVSTDVPRVYGGIDVGGGKLYDRSLGDSNICHRERYYYGAISAPRAMGVRMGQVRRRWHICVLPEVRARHTGCAVI